MRDSPNRPERVLVVAPTGRDGSLTVDVLRAADIHAELCASVEELCRHITQGAGAALVAEEALRPAALEALAATLNRQPPWSDFPFVVLGDPDGHTRREQAATDMTSAKQAFFRMANVTILERPFRRGTLLAAVGAALRARRKQYDARRAIQDRDEFLAMLGHELRNPLAAILFANQLATNPRVPPPEQSKQRDIVERQSRHLARLVDDLLDVSRVTTGKVQLQRVPLDLRDIVARSLDGVAALAQPAAITVESRLGAEPLVVSGDAARLQQVFTNLLTNAVKYTPAGGRVQVTLAHEGADVTATVSDTGVGIPPNALRRIFELFAQVQTSLDRSRGGMGIGLTVVKSLVELHGGTVVASSEGAGRGSQFTVRLPASHEKLGNAAPATTPRATARRVLVVEDNEDIRATLCTFLGLSGHTVFEARDGREAVEMVGKVHPEVALVDVGLPVLDGYEVARRVRKLADRPFLVAVTGYGQPEDRARAADAGFDDHLTKPVDSATLLAVLAMAPAAAAP